MMEYFSCYLSMVFNYFAVLKCYKLLNNEKLKFKFWYLLVILPCAMATFLTNYYIDSSIKMFITLLSLFVELKLISKENTYTVIFKLLMVYMTLLFCDFLISIVFLFFPINSVTDVGNITFIRCLNTLLVSILLLIIYLSKRVRRTVNKILDFIISRTSIFLLILLFFLFTILIILTYLSSIKFNIMIFAITLIVLISFSVLCFFAIYQYFKNKSVEKEQHALLNLMSEYERVLEKDRINRHEMVNNLIILKSTKDKASKDYEDLLDEIIKDYQIKKSEFYSKIYNLPSGIKGIIYYKLGNINTKNINIELLTNKKAKKAFENLNSKINFKVCKLTGILVDNAIEATVLTDNKYILLDLYLDNNDIVVYIENSYLHSIDINTIYEKGVSTKGDNRGYGLYIANKMIKESNGILELNQYINDLNNFVTVLKIKNSSND